MCDTILAPPSCTAGSVMLFGKNSDRQRNEAQAVELFPAADHAPDAHLACTYLTIPQARHKNAVLLCRPFWGWGAEMGANEHGVVIGNEGLNARSPAPQEPALTGMDLIRLALERAASAAEALEVIATLLERHGQGGNCGHVTPNYYNNGFMIADAREAFVLETVGREWLSARVRDVRAISNSYSIGVDLERTSCGLQRLIAEAGWSKGPEQSYADAIADRDKEHIGQSDSRRARSTALLTAGRGSLSAKDFMSILRDHGVPDPSGAPWDPRTATHHSLCIHAGPGRQPAQTTGAMLSEIGDLDSVHWVTGTAAPCLSIFKPVLMDVPFPVHGPAPGGQFDPRALWWRHERLHRAAVMSHLPAVVEDTRAERETLEAGFRERIAEARESGSTAERSRAVSACWHEAIEMEDRWLARVRIERAADDTPYGAEWRELNRLAGFGAQTSNS